MAHANGNFHQRLLRPTESSSGTQPPVEVGEATDRVILTGSAKETLSGHRIVTVDQEGSLLYADKDERGHAQRVLGMLLQAGTSDLQVLTEGSFEDPSMSFVVGPVFLGKYGSLTFEPPTSGFVLQVGKAVSKTKIYIHIGFPIALA